MASENVHFDEVFDRIGRGCLQNPDPENLEAGVLAGEFQRLADEFRVVPPSDLHARTGHAFTIDMLERAATLTRGLASMPSAFKAIENLGRTRGTRGRRG